MFDQTTALVKITQRASFLCHASIVGVTYQVCWASDMPHLGLLNIHVDVGERLASQDWRQGANTGRDDAQDRGEVEDAGDARSAGEEA